MKKKLLKLAKGLQKFTFDEIAVISEIDEVELKPILQELQDEEFLIKNAETYFYANPSKLDVSAKQKSVDTLDFTKANLKVLKIEEMKGYETYVNATDYKRRHADKYLKILSACSNLNGAKLQLFVKQWNKAYPNMKTSYSTIMHSRKGLKTIGLEAILPNYGHNKGKSVLENELYEHFKEFYLSFGANSYVESIELAVHKFKEKNPDSESQNFSVPAVTTFKRKLLNEFTQEEISAFRQKIIMPKVNMPAVPVLEEKDFIENKNITFKEASDFFLERVKTNLKKSSYISQKGYIKNHLMPIFGKKKLINITQEMVINFRDAKIEEGFSISSANSYMECIEQIIREYLPHSNQLDKDKVQKKKKENLYSDIRVLETSEIKKLLSTAKKYYPDFYPLVLTAITTGLTRGEILGLTWDCVDFKNKKLNIFKSLYRGEIIKHRTKYSIREVNLTDDTANVLQEWKLNAVKSEFVFPDKNGNALDPDNMIKRRFVPLVEKAGIKKIRFLDLRDTYASLLIKQNVPLTYVQQQLGHSSVDVTVKRYEKIILNIQVKDFKLL